ncbi:MAG: XRE family transcriptional regulator [Candidatus Bathyarchaeia archaeon]
MHLKTDKALAKRVGERIRQLRRLRNLAQIDLARDIGIKAGPMNLIEKGNHLPSGKVLYKIAQALGVPIDELFRPSPDTDEPYLLEVEEVTTTKKKDIADPIFKKRVQIGGPRIFPVLGMKKATLGDLRKINRLALTFLALEDLCKAQKRAILPLFFPFVPHEAGIEELVLRVRTALGIGHAVIFDYFELLENAGLRVIVCDFEGDVESLCAYDEANANAFLFIRNKMNPERMLFRLIFELGRIYWHTLTLFSGSLSYELKRSMVQEQEVAKKFAALFLMPAAAVRATVAQTGVEPNLWTFDLLLRLKHRFGVSAEAFLLRLEELNLIEHHLVDEFRAKIYAYYEETKFGEPDTTRRILTPNGRIGDLLHMALIKSSVKDRGELHQIARILERDGILDIAGISKEWVQEALARLDQKAEAEQSEEKEEEE